MLFTHDTNKTTKYGRRRKNVCLLDQQLSYKTNALTTVEQTQNSDNKEMKRAEIVILPFV